MLSVKWRDSYSIHPLEIVCVRYNIVTHYIFIILSILKDKILWCSFLQQFRVSADLIHCSLQVKLVP